jgi:YjjG family noncanonical pyrimidine nucleotidase
MKYILFDLDGTLMDFNKGEASAFIDTMMHFKAYTPSREEISHFSFLNERLFNQFAKGEMKRIEFQEKRFKEIMEYLDMDGDISLFNKYYVESLKYQADLFDGVVDVLEELSKKYRLFIASNGMNQVQIKRLKKARIYDYFEKIYISECIGYNKPDKEFFEYIIQDIKDDNTKEYIMIGDRYDTDIMGAKKVGIDGILLSKEKKDCITISSIKDILNIL